MSTPALPADTPPAGTGLRAVGLGKSYGVGAAAVPVLAGINLAAAGGEFVCVVGPSGAGKTTLLRCLAGLLEPSVGEVLLNGTSLTEPPAEIAVVFQDYSRSLMPWLKAIDNVALPLEGKGMAKRERLSKAREALALVGLEYAADRYPWQLSGGMQQRVAIARALAYEPQILLMDEPFASLDAQTRFELEDLALKVKQTLGVTIVFVTHDIDEAVYLGDRVVVIGRSPATVIEEIEIGLPEARDQIETRATPEFTAHRTHILRMIRDLAGQVPQK